MIKTPQEMDGGGEIHAISREIDINYDANIFSPDIKRLRHSIIYIFRYLIYLIIILIVVGGGGYAPEQYNRAAPTSVV